jgi:hypothetical protein
MGWEAALGSGPSRRATPPYAAPRRRWRLAIAASLADGKFWGQRYLLC